jgi:hypothetical protein
MIELRTAFVLVGYHVTVRLSYLIFFRKSVLAATTVYLYDDEAFHIDESVKAVK